MYLNLNQSEVTSGPPDIIIIVHEYIENDIFRNKDCDKIREINVIKYS